MSRALTMVETLLALALLSALFMALAAWTQVTAKSTTDQAHSIRWRAGAEAVLALIEDDLASGDFAPQNDRKDRGESRVTAAAGAMTIRSRTSDPGTAPGPTTRVYRYERPDHRLSVHQIDARGRTSARPLLDDVADWQCVFNDEERTVEVKIISDNGTTVTREWTLP